MKLLEISEGYSSRLLKYRAERDRIEKQIDRLERKRYKLTQPYWVEELVKPIANFLLPLLPGYDRYDILGPHGICCEVGVHFMAEGTSREIDPNEYFRRTKSIVFVPGELDKGELYWRNYDIEIKVCPPGSLGDMNGMNHPDTLIDPNSDLTELLDIINRDAGK
jgi:hypothetical protein